MLRWNLAKLQKEAGEFNIMAISIGYLEENEVLKHSDRETDEFEVCKYVLSGDTAKILPGW